MTHGMLRNRKTGVEIPAALNGRHNYFFNVNLDGDPEQRDFRSGIWEFIPDAPELPTTPGLYQIVRSGGVGEHKIEHAPTYRATGGDRWLETFNNRPISEGARRLLLNAHKDGRLIRLVLDPEQYEEEV